MIASESLVVPNNIKPGLLTEANFAQKQSKLGKEFSPEGIEIYSNLAGRPVNTVNDLVESIKLGQIKPNQVPIDFVDLDGTRLILNTRSSTALEKAGVPRVEWYGRDRTGITAYEGTTFDDLARRQLKNNGYTSEGRK